MSAKSKCHTEDVTARPLRFSKEQMEQLHDIHVLAACLHSPTAVSSYSQLHLSARTPVFTYLRGLPS